MNGLDLIIIMALATCALAGQAAFRRALRAQRKPVTGDDLTRAVRASYDNLPYNLQKIRGSRRAV